MLQKSEPSGFRVPHLEQIMPPWVVACFWLMSSLTFLKAACISWAARGECFLDFDSDLIEGVSEFISWVRGVCGFTLRRAGAAFGTEEGFIIYF